LLLATWAVAQPPADRSRVNPDDSTDTVRRMRLVDAYIEQNSWGEAVDLLQLTIDNYAHQVIAVPASSPPRYVSIRTYCHQRISQLPADALEMYRQRVDSQAEGLLARYEETRDQGFLYRVVDEFFCSSAADRAIDRLGDASFGRGDFDKAIEWWSKLMPPIENRPKGLLYPDSKVDAARVLAKWGIAQLMSGELESGQWAMRKLKNEYATSGGELAGVDGPYWKTLEGIGLDEANRAPASPVPHWTTFAGDFDRNKIARQEVRFGTIQHRWVLDSSPEVEEPERDFQEFNNPFPPFQQPSLVARRDGYYCHPLTLGSRVFVSNGRILYWFDVNKGEPIYQANLDAINERHGDLGDRTGYHTLTISGRWLFVRTGYSPNFLPNGHAPGAGRSRLICFDHETKRLAWSSDVASLDLGQQVVFEGSPVVRGNELYIGVNRLDAMVTSYVVCMDLETGEVRWKRLICESTNDWNRPVTPDQNLLTLAGDSLYYCTNQGAIAAIDVPTAKLAWLAEYDVEPTLPRGVRPAINPCLHHQGRLYAVPFGSSSLDCFDATTGEREWRTTVSAEHLLGIAHGLVFVTGDRVYAIDEKTGRVVWYFPENQPNGAGRGMLAGDLVYWPTASEIHVLDQRTGGRAEAAVSLIEGLRTKPGNLVPGDGYVLIAQNRQVLVVRPQSWLTEQREKLVAANPNSQEAHLLLATSAASEDIEKASRHFQQAIDLAQQLSVEEEENFVTRTKREWVRSILQHVQEEIDRAKDSTDQTRRTRWDDLLTRANRESVTADERWRVYSLRRRLWKNEADPRIRIMLAHDLLSDSGLMNSLVKTAPGKSVHLARQLESDLREEFVRSGEEAFGPWDEEFSAQRPAVDGSIDEVLAISRRFPLARDRAGYLLESAEQRREKDPREVLLLAAESVLSPRILPREKLRAWVLMESAYARLGADGESLAILDRLQRELGAESWKSEFGTTVDAYASARKLSVASGKPVGSPSASQISWTARSGMAVRMVEEESGGRGESRLIVSRGSESYACDRQTGRSEWKVDERCRFVRAIPTGLLMGSAGDVVCRDRSTGEQIWRFGWNGNEAAHPWRSVSSASLDGTKTGVQPLAADEAIGSVAVAREGTDLYLLSREGIVSRVCALTGQPIWCRDLSESGINGLGSGLWEEQVKVAGDRLLARTASRLVALDSDGEVRWDRRLMGESGSVDPVIVGDHLVTAVARDRVASIRLEDGKENWSIGLAWPSFGLPRLVEQDGRLAVLVDHFELVGVDPTDGKVLWSTGVTKSPKRQVEDRMALAGELLLTIGTDGVDARSLADGSLRWRVELGGVVSIHATSDRAFALCRPVGSATLVMIDVADGRVVDKRSLPSEGESMAIEWGNRGAFVRTAQQVIGVHWQ
jgi:outer membrane protein assembly factor BamB/tetratricopeptide (TPR) repeat protein